MVLMCKDQEVWNNGVVKHAQLCPLILRNGGTLEDWIEIRRAKTLTNVTARYLRKTVRQKLLMRADSFKLDFAIYCLSLSDCYWVRATDEYALFSNISPYYDKEWAKTGYAKGASAPSLMVDGRYDKHWIDSKYLLKTQVEHEHEACVVARELGFKVQQTVKTARGVLVRNLSDENVMLIQLMQLSADREPTMLDTIQRFGTGHFDTFLVDCLLYNFDRHAGNLANYIDANTGKNLGPTPIYDLDHSFNHRSTMLDTIEEFVAVTYALARKRYVMDICEKAILHPNLEVQDNALYLMNQVRVL